MCRRKWMTGIMSVSLAFVCAACGGGEAEKAGDEIAVEAAAETNEESEAAEPVAENVEEVGETLEDAGETETGAGEAEEVEEDGRYRIGDAELESIVQKYDKVLSTYDLEYYFGYNIPAGWNETWAEWDGMQEEKMTDEWRRGDDSVLIQSISRPHAGTTIVSYYDADGNEIEIQSDYYEYEDRYSEAIQVFCETGEWKEPKRASNPSGSVVEYCTDRIFEGKTDTPYGEGILYSAIYEAVPYTGFDEEKRCYTQIDEAADGLSHYYFRREGMFVEVDEYFVQVEFGTYDWFAFEGKGSERVSGIEYSGKLEEILAEMF